MCDKPTLDFHARARILACPPRAIAAMTVSLPSFSEVRAEDVLPRVEAELAAFSSTVDALLADPTARDFERLLAPLERHDARLTALWQPVSHLTAMRKDPALREAHDAALERITDHGTALMQNRALYEAVQALADAPAYAGLDAARRRLVDNMLRDFRLSGVALEGAARERFRTIANRLAVLGSEFEQALTDATDAWHLDVPESRLAGMPPSALSVLRQAARDAGVDGCRITLHGPCVQAVMTFCPDRELRAGLYHAYHTRASELGPNAGTFDNSARMEEILALRHEAAALLGFDSAAHESLATKMARQPHEVLDFLADLVARARPVAERELAELAGFARDQLDIGALEPWDIPFAAERLREQRFHFSEEDLKPYFPLPAVLAGLFDIVGTLFGVRFVEREVERWHEDARYYDVVDGDGARRAGVYLDLYARPGKRGGAWMDVCRSRIREGDAIERPVAFLVCNFAPPGDDRPALLGHDDVTTLFHEFGHGLHHLLTEVDWPAVGGIHGVEWDAVELPSQLLENFCWQPETLRLLSRHVDSGESLPDELIAKLRQSRTFHAGLFLLRQLEFGLFDFRLHLDYDPGRGARVMDTLAAVREQVAVVRPPAWQRFPHSFGHIFAGGYGAGYYSYLWAELLSADAFGRFEELGLLAPEAGAAFRREVLAVGGSRPAAESFRAFRGRDPEPEALLRSYGLAA
jgi:oligopeptidase A